MFAYCNNNPVNHADTEGKMANIIIGGVIGAIAGGISAAIKGENVLFGALVGGLTGMAAGTVGVLAPGASRLVTAGINGLIGMAGEAFNQYINYRLQDKAKREHEKSGNITSLGSTSNGQSQEVANRAYSANSFWDDYANYGDILSAGGYASTFSFIASYIPDPPSVVGYPAVEWPSLYARNIMLNAELSALQVCIENKVFSD